MINRLRIVLLAVAMLVAAALFSVTTAPAANADPADGCMKPSLTGTIGVQSGEFGLSASYTNTRAFANATCAASSYSYRVTFYPWVSNDVASVTASSFTPAYTCAFLICSRAGTHATFPNTTADLGGSFQTTYVKIEATRRNFGIPIEEQTQYYAVNGVGSYNTSSHAQVADPTQCSASTVPGPIIGSRGFCP